VTRPDPRPGRLLLVGLDDPEVEALKLRLPADLGVVAWPVVPPFRLVEGELEVESASVVGRWLTVDRVVFHGVFERDLELITALALWRGPCLPDALGLLDLRERIPALARTLRATRFGALPRGLALPPDTYTSRGPAVAKWGVWHCGEDKARFTGDFTPEEPSVVEPFVEGESVRVCVIGDEAWQIRLVGHTGSEWLRSIHHDDARIEAPDAALVADARAMCAHFGMRLGAVDYQVGRDGTPHLLELNHAPNVTRFAETREAFLALAAAFAATSP
jgi:hypothetical protein